MTIDVIDLRDFYSQRLGIVARRLINRGIHARWPDAQGQRVLGLGYPTPYLGLFREDSERCIAFMPAAQGVLKWPTARPALATLVDEFSLPLPDAAVDRILLVHALEMSDDPEGLLREVWRVLAPSGRLMAVIPNRRGVWTRTDATPFGHGRPYSRSQITQLLRQTWFTPIGMGRGAVHAAGQTAAGSCVRRWPGSASARRCRCHSPACISWKPPSRSIARSRRTANARA